MNTNTNYMTLSKKNVQIVPLLIITLGLVTYNFMSAQWKGPTAAPPDSNTAAPINEGTTTQSKLGNFNANNTGTGNGSRGEYYP